MYVVENEGFYIAYHLKKSGNRHGSTTQRLPAVFQGKQNSLMEIEILHTLSDDISFKTTEVCIHSGNRVLVGNGIHLTRDVNMAYQWTDKKSAIKFLRKIETVFAPVERHYRVIMVPYQQPREKPVSLNAGAHPVRSVPKPVADPLEATPCTRLRFQGLDLSQQAIARGEAVKQPGTGWSQVLLNHGYRPKVDRALSMADHRGYGYGQRLERS